MESLLTTVIPAQYQPQPLFAYAVYTRNAATAPVPLASSIYSSPDDTYRGYSYQTEYEGGGRSEVVFVTGPQANQLLQKSVERFRTIVPPEEQPTGRSLSSNATSNSTTASSTTPANSNSSGTSYYNLQLYPAHTSPFTGFVPPLQNLISSFAYTITNDIANSIKDASENTEEAQESMIHGDVLTPPVRSTSTEVSQSSTSAPQTTSQSPSEGTSTVTTTKITTTTIATTTPAATTTANPEPTTNSKTPDEEKNDVADLNTTTHASDEIMETTSA